MEAFIELLVGWFLWLVGRVKPKTRGRRRRHLPVRVFPQTYDYSCCASALQTALHVLTGEVVEHDEAVILTKCAPNGAQLSRIATVIRRRCPVRPKRLSRLAAVRRALNAGQMVISTDCVSWGGRHAIVLVGATPAGFYIADSNVPVVRWKREAWVRRAADEFIAIEPKNL